MESFSFNTVVGKSSLEDGMKRQNYYDGKRKEYSGGVPVKTLFKCALKSGLESWKGIHTAKMVTMFPRK
jgi:vancomycin resistance protein YoaR